MAGLLCVHAFLWSNLECENRYFSNLAIMCLCMCILKYAFKGRLSENGKWQCITRSETWDTASRKELGWRPTLVDFHSFLHCRETLVVGIGIPDG